MRIEQLHDVQGQALPHRVAQLPQLGGGGELGDLAAHQLVQLLGGEGGDNLALLVGERGEELLEEHERCRQAVLGAEEGRKELGGGGEGSKEPQLDHLLEEHERGRQAVLGADNGRMELVQLLHQPFFLQKLSSGADGVVQAVHVVGDTVGVCHVDAGVVHEAVWGFCNPGTHPGCSEDSHSHGDEDFAAY